MTGTLNRKARFLAGFVVYFVALWLLWGTPVVYPLKIFVVLLHEASHAMVAVATGGTIQRIVLDPYQGGACYCPGGNALLTLSAGYLGSLAWGAALTEAARARRV
ncbi:MAG TPA: M50 family metallopeptidase, partial [Longimicrobiales bacterium]|nr:M50 family metallopeptidase [Longimicrobiales bacterium]